MDTTFINSENSKTSKAHVLILKLANKLYFKKNGENVDKPSVQIYINKIENRVTFKIKNGYALELQTSETMKLIGNTEKKITKDKNGENVPHFEITEVWFEVWFTNQNSQPLETEDKIN